MVEDFDSLLALLRRTTDEGGWLQPMLDDPDSAAVLGARIAIFARLGAAVDHNGAQATISGASGGQPGTCSLTVSRVSGSTTGTIPAGYPFIDQRGARALLQADVVVGSGQLSKVLPLVTARKTELVNTDDDPGFEVAPDAPTIPGSSGILIAPAGTGGMTSTTFQAIGPSTKITGAGADYLSAKGRERGLPRQQGETAADYRQRIRNIPDAVSPIAVADVVQAAAQRPGLPPFKTLEPFDLGETLALKDLHGLGSFTPQFLDDYDPANPFIFKGGFLDDPLSGDVLVSRREATAYLEIRAQDFLHDTNGAVLFVDDGFLDDPVLGFPDLASGMPPGSIGALLGIVTQVQKLKGGGVNFDLFLQAPSQKTAYGTRSSAAFGAVAILTPTTIPASIWAVEELIASVRIPDDSTATPEHFVKFFLEDGSTFDSPTLTRRDGYRVQLPEPHQRITQIQGFLRSNGTVLANLTLTAIYVEYVI